MERPDTELAMLIEMAKAAPTVTDGRVLVNREQLVGALEGIREGHRRELQAIPTIAGRLFGAFEAAT